ncbi:MAG: hypothetical protein QF570_08030 [Myxococcota bacterium]|jgi:hypothetical protein|nr:hypothetical protein [Myxococcota bacterium]
MHFDLLAVVVLTAFVQSLFGVGVLLFGTPMLLVLGYDFISTLVILLPISLAINALQVGRHRAFIDGRFYRRILTTTVPGVVLFLFLVTQWQVNVSLIVGLFLIVVAMENGSSRLGQLLQSLFRHERAYFSAMGAVHGMTNLGGSLLTAIVHNRNYEKDVARVTTAVSYATIALFQLMTLAASGVPAQAVSAASVAYVGSGVGTFVLTERLVYARLDTARYQRIFATFLLASGVLLVGKSFLG